VIAVSILETGRDLALDDGGEVDVVLGESFLGEHGTASSPVGVVFEPIRNDENKKVLT